MYSVYIYCLLTIGVFLALFQIWGRFALQKIQLPYRLCDSMVLGFIILVGVYQIPYLITMMLRGSYRLMSWIWLITVSAITIAFEAAHLKQKIHLQVRDLAGRTAFFFLGAFLILSLSGFIALHAPAYGPDTDTYINGMNGMYYSDVIWIDAGSINYHQGINSLFGFFTMASIVTGIKPFYVSLFVMRSILVILTALVVYRTGTIAFNDHNKRPSWKSALLTGIVLFLIMNWNSMYQAQFFFRRSNEAKAYCQFVLLPFAFSVFLQMIRRPRYRQRLWCVQMITGFSAVAISMSSLTSFPMLVLIGLVALLIYDRCRHLKRDVVYSAISVIPNLLYLALYYSISHGFITV